MSEDKKWAINFTNIDKGIFRSMNGNADEMIAVGRIIKAGFPCSRVDVTNAKYDAVVDLGGYQKVLRVQIKGSGTGIIDFTGGSRSGKQISREVKQRTYKYSQQDCDLIIGVDTTNGDCYIIPIEELSKWKNSTNIKNLQQYKENWQILVDLVSTNKIIE
jgi:formylglycine-generating enzyme required for sulfatase activity